MVKLTYDQKVKQAMAFTQFLKDKGYTSTSLTRDRLKQIYSQQFKDKLARENPDETCIGFSNLRYMQVTRGWLVRSGKNFVVVDGTPSPTQSPQKKSRRKKIARLAVDQHIALQQSESKGSFKLSAPTPKPQQRRDGSPKLAFDGKRYECKLCKVKVGSKPEAEKHVSGKKHHVQNMLCRLKEKREILVRDKHDVSITCEHQQPDGSIRATIQEDQPSAMTITITNQSASRGVVFKRCDILKRVRVFQLDDVHRVTDGMKTVRLKPGESYEVTVNMHAKNVGSFQTIIAFAFGQKDDAGLSSTSTGDQPADFHIVRYMTIRCANSLIEDLQPEAPYVPPPRVSSKPSDVEIVDGFPLPSASSEPLEREIVIEQHYVDPLVRKFVNRGLGIGNDWSEKDTLQATERRDMLVNGLTVENHASRFDLLLQIEEIQMEVDIRKYDMEGVKMDKSGPRLLMLKVHGLAEKRPSVLKGDCLYVRIFGPSGKPEGCEYKGYVHDVGPEEVYLGFSQKLLDLYVSNMKFSVRFTFSRLPIRVEHRAVQLAEENSLEKMLFPTKETIGTMGTVPSENIRFFDQRISGNREQQEAVKHILEGSSRPAPFLIFGPPGTGKTVTMVEAIKQVVTRIRASHILVCAPSNSAADLLAERLLTHLDKSSVFRMHALSRVWSAVPEKIRPCSNYDKSTKNFFYPCKADIGKYRVVVCTLVTAGRIVSANFPAGHFTHVFVDEAGHATEPEALIPFSGVLECDFDPDALLDPVVVGQCVLAGDPQQLGAVIRSPIAIKYGLGMSFLERLMTRCDVYRREMLEDGTPGPYNPQVLTKLVRNYRSHPAILHLPNLLFYEDELEVHADVAVRESLCRWEGLPKKGFPLIFHGTTALELREARSPSFFNPTEVSEVVNYVEELLAARGAGIRLTGKDIGIITPYRKQVQKVRKALTMRNLSTDIKVGSVEEFQGQERHVIIISTVRTSPKYVAMDVDYKLGFLKNPKRFNVSITRAKALAIVVGNPFILSKDKHWNEFLEYCIENGAYKGVDFEPEEERLEDLVQRFGSLGLDSGLAEKSPISVKELIEGPEWRADD